MSLNPIQFGNDVIDQFGRYLLTTFPIADERLAQQVKERFQHGIDNDPLLYKGPYVYLNQPFEPGPTMREMIAEVDLHPAMEGVFPFPALHYHQAEALRTVKRGKHLILSTGTGSGKTEAFMLPIIDHCLRPHLAGALPGVVAVLVYPMNALVNDQLERLRWTLAGTGITFGRYTGETPRQHHDDMPHQFNAPVSYGPSHREAHANGTNFGSEILPMPHEECTDQQSIRERQPRILLTNYAQLEYLLLRDKDLDLFRRAPLRYMVFDEVHTYTGALGSEVACLVRRLRNVAQKSPDEVTMIGTSATVSDRPDEDTDGDSSIDTEAMTRRFAHRLFGVPQADITVVRETYRDLPETETYVPPLPEGMTDSLAELLQITRTLQLQTEVTAADLPQGLIDAVEYLCGRQRRADLDTMQALGELLASNRCVRRLSEIFDSPQDWEQAIPRYRTLGNGRGSADEDALKAEMMAYLLLGALIKLDGDPLLRPKVHYFVQGLQGLGIRFQPEQPSRIEFGEQGSVPPLILCRSCGQHYTRLIARDWQASEHSRNGYRLAQIPEHFQEPDNDDGWLYLTDRFHTSDEDDDVDDARWEQIYVCSVCNTVHEKQEPACLNPQCRMQGSLVGLFAYNPAKGGTPKRCGACSGPNSEKTPLLSYTRSAAVADVTILAQSMLTMMQEQSLRKVLIFADSRQEAAFQAGWMDERSKRFRIRHMMYQTAREHNQPLNWDDFRGELIARAMGGGVFERRDFRDQVNNTRAGWYMVEEFAYVTQRRSNLEQLGLVGVAYGDLWQSEDDTFAYWADRLGVEPDDIRAVMQLLLDAFRRRGYLSTSLLSRYWSNRDKEVYSGWVRVPDFYRPKALVQQKPSKSPFLSGWLAKNGRSTAQVIVASALKVGSNTRDEFLRDVWDWFVKHHYLLPIQMTQRRAGKNVQVRGLPAEVYHVNLHRVGLFEAGDFFVCSHCHRTQQVMTPTGNCPEYNCNGRLAAAERDMEHYDVYQYTQLDDFVSMGAAEHTAQVPHADRLKIERDFKNDTGITNTIVATPTLEMGVDIGKLEMVMMRNVPPTPANYAQRAGRAGRRHRIGVVFTYAGASQHDRYFYADPPEAIAGAVRIPAFSMRNAPLVRKHVHSLILTSLREWVTPAEAAVLETTFPQYIVFYLGEYVQDADGYRLRFFDQPASFDALSNLIARYRPQLLERLQTAFSTAWSDDEQDQEAVSVQVLARYVDGMAEELTRHIRVLFTQVRAYRAEQNRLRQIENLRNDEKRHRNRIERAIKAYTERSIENYTLSWLASDGFFPGYALSRASVQATNLDPFIELSRPSAVALRELTPANWVYANRRVFNVQRLNYGKLQAQDPNFTTDQLRDVMGFDVANERLYRLNSVKTEGGQKQRQEIISYQLTDVEMEPLQGIDDSRESRRRIAFNIHGLLLDQHAGGFHSRVGQREVRLLRREQVRLVNRGPMRKGPTGIDGFPLCPVCGETRSPAATQQELDDFNQKHQERCHVSEIGFVALHVDLTSDVLCVGPFEAASDAVNTYEGLLAGARAVLDMSDSELEGFLQVEENGDTWAVLYDPLPGGTGFIDQMLERWMLICERGREALGRCDCEEACYKCLQHFRNQQHHGVLNRHDAMRLLGEINGQPHTLHQIPASVQPTKKVNGDAEPDSTAEQRYLQLLAARSFRQPDALQHRIDLNNGNYTVADFAWVEARVLVFVDGTSSHLHGDPQRARQDRLKRAMAGKLSWNVLVITAQSLDDQQLLSDHLDELSIYLS